MEIIVIDDGSADDSWQIISSWSNPQLRIFSQDNIGLPATLNRGLSLATGRYIARQDQDDLLLPGRLKKQQTLLDREPEIGLVGTWAQIYAGSEPTQRLHCHPSSDAALRLRLLFDNPFVHSSMMMRADLLKQVGGYSEDPALQPPEDFDLWSRMAPVCRIANIPEVLTVYREVSGSVSRTGVSPFLTNIIRISTENLTAVIGAEFNRADCHALAELFSGVTGSSSLLPFRTPRKMLRLAAEKIAGEKITWSREFSDTFTSLNRLLIRRMTKAYISTSAAGHWLGGKGQHQS